MQIRPTAFTFGLIIYSFISLFLVYTEFGIDSKKCSTHKEIARKLQIKIRSIRYKNSLYGLEISDLHNLHRLLLVI